MVRASGASPPALLSPQPPPGASRCGTNSRSSSHCTSPSLWPDLWYARRFTRATLSLARPEAAAPELFTLSGACAAAAGRAAAGLVPFAWLRRCAVALSLGVGRSVVVHRSVAVSGRRSGQRRCGLWCWSRGLYRRSWAGQLGRSVAVRPGPVIGGGGAAAGAWRWRGARRRVGAAGAGLRGGGSLVTGAGASGVGARRPGVFVARHSYSSAAPSPAKEPQLRPPHTQSISSNAQEHKRQHHKPKQRTGYSKQPAPQRHRQECPK